MKRNLSLRIGRFYGVGALGIGVQFALLTLSAKLAHLPVSLATAIAVWLTVAHNFAWHERYTFGDRVGNQRTAASIAVRYLRFNLTNGAISLLGNVIFTTLLVQYARLPLLAANAAAIVICGLLNFLASDRLVFRKTKAGPMRATT